MPMPHARPVYHPAGHDAALRAVLQDLRAGRWVSTRTLLGETRDWATWTQRTQILATAVAGSDLLRVWHAEEPHSVALAVLHARVAVERALRAHRSGHRHTAELWRETAEACRYASQAAPDDPVPWIGLLALAQLDDGRRREEHRMPAPEPMLFDGPWQLLAQADKRDPGNREAYHRMLQFAYRHRPGTSMTAAVNFVQWAASSAPAGSALHMLPLYARVERYRREGGQERALDLHWISEEATRGALHALHMWFDHTTPAPEARSLLDLNHLAHALWGAHRFDDALRVFDALDPYFTVVPWSYRTATPGSSEAAADLFTQARARCRAAAGRRGRDRS
ncbi:hypothetical protein [Streptomyces cavernicola]|uniref:DUF4034 domain-containing protein n=1 Tax=Streptomyces cavernicola TaxID=3043613 RepID=A0ABT6S6N3_9ACTN|nr:hypothetical protein [Streptomyces sp. B-S-A6]MDI3403758.1 hypothetical protein [Streptomyces sp. B-S-A6]